MPGTATLNRDGNAAIDSVSCASAGNCSAGGYYTDASGQQAFVVSQADGTWRNAEEVPGTAALNQGGEAGIDSVSCASAGNCNAAGYYSDASGNQQVFVVSQADGTWQNAEEVPGSATLNQGGAAEIYSVSCVSANSCSAGGRYRTVSNQEAFLVSKN